MPAPLNIDWQNISLDLTRIVSGGLAALAWIVGGLILYRVGRRIIRGTAIPKYVVREDVALRAATARGLLISVWKYAVIFAVFAALVSMMPIALLPAAAIVSAAGLVVALGVQSLFRDIIAGFSIVVEGQFAVGDHVRMYGVDVEGTVEAVGLRVSVVRDDDGSRVFVPNGAITAVRNFSEASGDAARRARRGRPRREDAPVSQDRPPRPERIQAVAAPSANGDAVDRPAPDERNDPRRKRRRRGGQRRRTPGERLVPTSSDEAADAPEPAAAEQADGPREILDNSPWSID